ncbi:transporter substrate-binding domain-containing protein [Pseudomonas sp. GL-RE-20]|uniref:transporter substrate-binding domain-containing protein n=1 Tax=Pseudomonas sp. GL-RE-20 TaxID=2832372 RepID=UPI001CC18225
MAAGPPANRAAFLQQGKVDLLIANMTVTPERANNWTMFRHLTSSWAVRWWLHATQVSSVGKT